MTPLEIYCLFPRRRISTRPTLEKPLEQIEAYGSTWVIAYLRYGTLLRMVMPVRTRTAVRVCSTNGETRDKIEHLSSQNLNKENTM